MSGVQQRLKLKQTAIDTWSLREHLTLASAVLRSGDQNWVSVSRTMKQAGEPGRPQDWFSQKNCALQYNLLQEKMDIPRPKRGEKVEEGQSPAEIIVKKLSVERAEELQKILEEEKAEILRLEEETELLSSEDITEEQLQKILWEVEAEEAEEDRKEAEHAAWLASREAKKLEIQQALKSSYIVAKKGVLGRGERMSQSEHSGSELDSAVDSPAVTDSLDSDQLDVEGVAPPPALPASAPLPHHDQPSPTSSSPLLTALLHSPTRTTIQSPTFPLFPSSPYKTPSITTQLPAVANLSQKFSSTSTITVASLAPLIMSSSAVSTASTFTKIVSPEASFKSSMSLSSGPSVSVTKPSSSKVEIPTTLNVKPMETMQEVEDKFEETEAVNDAVEVMDTNEEVDEQSVKEVIGQVEQIIFKSEDEDMTDTLTDIDELLRDKLKESELIPASKVEEQVVEEVVKHSADREDSVNLMTDESSVIEASVGKEEINTKITEEIKHTPVDDKIENIDNRSTEAGCQTPKTKNEFEIVETKVEEIIIKEEENETPKEMLLEHEKIVESKINDPDTVISVIASEDIPELAESSCEDHTVMEGIPNSKEDNELKSVVEEEPSLKPCSSEKDEPEAVSSDVVKPVESSDGVDGVESVPCSPPTPSASGSVTPTPPGPSSSTSSTPPSATPTTPIPAPQDEDKDYKMWKKSIILVWGQIAQHKNANLFAGAVSEADAPEYREIVYRPMDLNSIKKNIESGHIKDTEGLERDLKLMFLNAIMYNSSDHEVYNLTKDMMEDTEKIVKDYKNTQALLKADEPKALRGKSESSNSGSPAAVEGHYRPRGRSVSGTLGDSPVARSGGQEDRKKRERTVSMVDDIGGRGEKKRRKLDQ